MPNEYRDDGWPLCPKCGDDELMSSELTPAPTDSMKCLACGWRGHVAPARWSNLYERRRGRLLSVNTFPTHDEREHAMRRDCWCKPKTRTLEGGAIQIVHNAADQRELTEEENAIN